MSAEPGEPASPASDASANLPHPALVDEHLGIASSHATGERIFWIFGYGSLMWNPGFPYVRSAHAVLPGFHRSFCVRSTVYRGTPEQPGLVLGIDAGGECNGMAFGVELAHAREVLAYLFEREMRAYVYSPTWVGIEVDGARVRALTFVVQRDHRQFACLAEHEIVAIIASSAGINGSNFDYLGNTVRALHALGVPDADLDALHARVEDYVTSGPGAASRTTLAPARSP